MEILENPPYTESFEEVFRIRHQLLKLLTDEKFSDLLDVVNSIPETDVNLTALKIIWELMLTADKGNIEVIEKTLKKGLELGIWFSKTVLGDFATTIVDKPKLMPLIDQHEKRYLDCKEEQEAQLIIRTPRDYKSGKRYPIILFFDGRHSNHRISEFYWKQGLETTDVIFASLRSSQRKGFAQYVWDDKTTSLQEVGETFEILRKRSDVDEDNIIVSGMSQGSNVAIQSIASDIIPARGFITIAQAVKPELFFGKDSPTLVGKNIRGVIVSGEKDRPRHPRHKEFYELAQSHGIDCRF
ncbi:MAG: hypothetical protein ACW98Y_11075, partial [Candidatus Thorarchaeota archaeon]